MYDVITSSVETIFIRVHKMAWIITYKGKPVTIYQLAEIVGTPQSMSWDNSIYIATRIKAACIDIFNYNFGSTWKARKEGIECEKITVGKE